MTQSAPETETGADGTGVASVDEVLADLAQLDGLPVAEHVAVFERAHAALGQALTS